MKLQIKNNVLCIMSVVCGLLIVGCSTNGQPAKTDGNTVVQEMIGDKMVDTADEEQVAPDSVDGESVGDDQVLPEDSLFYKLLPPKVPSSFNRCEKTFEVPSFRDLQYSVCVDFPKQTLHHYSNVQTWLIGKFEEALDSYWEADFSGQVKRLERAKRYKGSIYSNRKIVEFYKDDFFKGIHQKFGDSADSYPLEMSHVFRMEAVMATDRVVSFRYFINNYYGGAHGMMVERLCSFDPVHRKEVDWDYLFNPQDRDSILMLLADEALRNEKFIYWEGHRIQQMDEAQRRRFLMDVVSSDHPTLILPSVGLSQDGFVFSYQHYALSCFAAGAFHFMLSYATLAPFLTERGQWICEQLIHQ